MKRKKKKKLRALKASRAAIQWKTCDKQNPEIRKLELQKVIKFLESKQ